MIKRANKACRFYPCHMGLEDCTFCYCPFYPCLDKKKGEYIYSAKTKRNIWSCEGCNWIHKKKFIDGIFALIKKEYPLGPGDCGIAHKDKKIGIIILGHGSKLHKANRLISEVVKTIRKKNGYDIIEPSHLQFHSPGLKEAVRKIVRKGCEKIIVVPFFLFRGNHVERDIPLAIKEEMRKYPGVSFIFTKSLGEDEKIADIVLKNINEAIGRCL